MASTVSTAGAAAAAVGAMLIRTVGAHDELNPLVVIELTAGDDYSVLV